MDTNHSKEFLSLSYLLYE
ncbi:hypothetical protein PF022_08380 [Helicobacter sp. WB40]|nr:hypothetical protein [Helicobacter sp. WB40]MDA3967970.1 hypothetical protein [Helicobacter sp. WB40]